MHIEGLGPHVAEGHYDLLGPHGEIILPHVWETVIEPDWTITMHMWPMNDDKEEEAAAEDAAPDIEAVAEGVPPPPPPAPSPPDGANKHGAHPTLTVPFEQPRLIFRSEEEQKTFAPLGLHAVDR